MCVVQKHSHTFIPLSAGHGGQSGQAVGMDVRAPYLFNTTDISSGCSGAKHGKVLIVTTMIYNSIKQQIIGDK